MESKKQTKKEANQETGYRKQTDVIRREVGVGDKLRK